MLLLRARTLFYYPRDWRRSNLCSETWSGPNMGCICFIHSSRKNIDPLRTKLKIEPLLTQLLWPCTDFTRARGKSAAIITQQTDQMSQPHPGVSAHLLKYCRTCSRWFDLLDCSYFPFLIIYFNMTDKQMTLSDCSGCLHLASCKTPSGSFLFHKVHDYFSFVVLQLSFMSRVFWYKVIYARA